MKRHGLSRLALAALLAALAPAALAQRPPDRNGSEEVARRAERTKSLGHALGRAARARQELRLRHFDRATELAEFAAQDLEELGGRDYATEAYEVMAEAALLQGRPAQALRATDAVTPHLILQRLAMTRALALIGVGRTAEAREIVLREVGTPDKPERFRDYYGVPHFPIDVDDSVKALTASAYFIRFSWHYSVVNSPEDLDDIKAAFRLTPDDYMVRLGMARAQMQTGQLEEARANYLLGAKLSGNNPELKPRFRTEWAELTSKIAAAKAATDAGTQPKSGG